MRNHSSRSIDLGLLFVVLVWGFSPSLFKIVLEEINPLTFVFMRFVALSVLAVLVLAWRGWRGGRAWRITRGDIPLLIISGLSGYGIYQMLYIVGLAHTSVFASALLASTVPLWSAVILVVLRAERVHWLQWVGIAISLVGVSWFLLAAVAPSSRLAHDQTLSPGDLLLGNALTLTAAVLFALYGVVNKRLGATYSPPELMCYTLLVGTLALAPLGVPAVLSQDWSQVTWHTWVILPYSVFFPIYITYSIWNWAIRERGVGYVTLFSYAVPVMSGVVGFLAFGESLTWVQVGGGALVLGGMLAARWGVNRTRRRGLVAALQASQEAEAQALVAAEDPQADLQAAAEVVAGQSAPAARP